MKNDRTTYCIEAAINLEYEKTKTTCCGEMLQKLNVDLHVHEII